MRVLKMAHGRNRKHPQMDIGINRLYLDTNNPRLPENIQGTSEAKLLNSLYRGFNLDELAESMCQNGYFDEEPLVVIPKNLPKKLSEVAPDSKEFKTFIDNEKTTFTVVEGNRRLATVKLIVDSNLRSQLKIKHWPEPLEDILSELKLLPTIVYTKRSDVIPYLGVKHIVGIQKWDSYAKARYVAQLVDKGQTLQDVESQIGDTQGSARKNYIGYKLLQQAKAEFDYDTEVAENNFSLLILSVGQGKIKKFLGLPTKIKDINPDAPVPEKSVDNLKNLMGWLFGDGKQLPAIKESRDITSYLSHVVASPEALKHLERTRELKEAYDLSDGEEQMLLRYLASANRELAVVLGMIHRYKTSEDVITEVQKCIETAKQLLKTVSEK